jgi:protein-S-isoprenylcysteine O-methyltransferase Ste14
MVEIRKAAPHKGKHWSDWAGFVTFLASAFSLVLRAGALTVMLGPTFLHELLVAFLFLIRGPAKSHLAGWKPRVAAYGGSFVMLLFVQTAYVFHTDWVAPSRSKALLVSGSVLWLVGSVAGIWTLWRLRRSFSVEPQARSLVTTGPYRFARHPIYTAYALQYVGIWLGHPSVALASAVLVWFLFTLARMHYEEAVLEGTFPEYSLYRAEVGAFAPRFRPVVREKPAMRTAA